MFLDVVFKCFLKCFLMFCRCLIQPFFLTPVVLPRLFRELLFQLFWNLELLFQHFFGTLNSCFNILWNLELLFQLLHQLLYQLLPTLRFGILMFFDVRGSLS